jgi:hypothetical protein
MDIASDAWMDDLTIAMDDAEDLEAALAPFRDEDFGIPAPREAELPR